MLVTQRRAKQPATMRLTDLEGQLAASSRTQLVAVLPQGTLDSAFGTTPVPGAKPGDKPTKSFDPDAYIDNVTSVLVKLGLWKAKPSVTGVMLSGHSGAGELLNEKILGSGLGSNIGAGAGPTTGSKLPAAFKELALFDGINGPNEHARLHEFLTMKLAAELANVLAKPKEEDRISYLKSSFKFRGYFSHDSETKNFYSQWYVGPVVSAKAVYKESIQDLISKFFTSSATALGGSSSAVFQAFKDNYKVIDSGTVAHPAMVAANENLKDAIRVLPKRADGSSASDALIPPSVYQTLQASGNLWILVLRPGPTNTSNAI